MFFTCAMQHEGVGPEGLIAIREAAAEQEEVLRLQARIAQLRQSLRGDKATEGDTAAVEVQQARN